MRKEIYSASRLTLTLALVAAAALAAPTVEAQSTGSGSISVPPFVTRGFPPYSDGTPCIGTPKDPSAWPDKTFNPCDGIPLQPERLPGPFPPAPPAVNVTAPGGQTVPPSKPAEPDHRAGQFAPYEDGTPCVGRPKDLARRPNKETNPCVPEPEATTSTPDGKHEPIQPVGPPIFIAPSAKPGDRPVPTIKQRPDGSLYIEYPAGDPRNKKKLGFALGLFSAFLGKTQASGSLGEFEYKTEPPNTAAGEIKRTLTIYKQTGQVVLISIEYQDGRIVDEQFRIGGNGSREFYTVYKPHPAKKGYYKAVESIYDVHGSLKEVRFYNPDGTLDRVMVPEEDAPAPVKQGLADLGRGKPTPYLPPFTALRPAGEVNDVTPQNQSAINAQLKNSKRPVFRLAYSSTDAQAKNMSDWLDRAAKANPAVVFLRLDKTKFAMSVPEPSVTFDIPRPTRSFDMQGWKTDADLDKFLADGLAAWTPITHQRP